MYSSLYLFEKLLVGFILPQSGLVGRQKRKKLARLSIGKEEQKKTASQL